MVNIYGQKKELAYKYLEIALKYNQFDYFVMGYPGVYIDEIDKYGNKIMDVSYTVEAIYDYYKTHSDSNIEKDFNDILIEQASTNLDIESVYNIFRVTNYCMQREKSNGAPFSISGLQILDALKKNLQKNKEQFNRKMIRANNDSFKELTSEYIDETIDEFINCNR